MTRDEAQWGQMSDEDRAATKRSLYPEIAADPLRLREWRAGKWTWPEH